jgi:hypothetical protein
MCSESLDMPDANSWEAALAETREAEWRSVQKSGAWEHLCPSCYAAYAEAQKKRRG